MAYPDPALPALTAPAPSLAHLAQALPTIQLPNHDPALKIAWARDVLFLVDRASQNASTDTPIGPVHIQDPQLNALAHSAVLLILQIAASIQPVPSPAPPYVAEAIYHRATLAASGAFPEHIKHNPRAAFRDFEQAARSGYPASWFRLGRDYENFNDAAHARECFERGVKFNIESCIYRMGMAHLMGQLGLPAQPALAIPLLHRAATLASIHVPQPAYVYGLLLLSEFSHITVPPNLFLPFLPPPPPGAPLPPLDVRLQLEAQVHLLRAAYLNFAPAQYKLGHAYEFAQPPFSFDALLSVQYYSLASQQGEIEADMALSKWFLCGAEGAFEKDEALAYTFAEKAARRGLPSAEFAMGYYAEVGVGRPKDIEAARKWYKKAADHSNADAAERLAVLSQPSPQSLSRQEHDTITEAKLVRKRTQARQRSERVSADMNQAMVDGQGASVVSGDPGREAGGMNGPTHRGNPSTEDARQVVELVRKTSLAHRNGTGPAQGIYPPTAPMTPLAEHEQYQSASGGMPVPNTNAPYTPPAYLPVAEPRANSTSPRLTPHASPPGLAGHQARQFPNQHRYTLVDPGSTPVLPSNGVGGPSTPPSRVQSPQIRPPGRRTPSAGPHPPSQYGPGPGPGTPQQQQQLGHDTYGAEDASLHSQMSSPQPGGPHPPRRGPTTFAEMGIQGVKLEEKECVIM